MTRMPCRAVLLFAAAIFFAVAAPAVAGTVQFEQSNYLAFSDTEGERNTLTVTSPSADTLVLTDTASPITAGEGCTQRSANTVECTQPAGWDFTAIDASLGGGDDTYEGGGNQGLDGFTPNVVDGGPGDDTVTGNEARDVLRGGGGTDSLHAQQGRDRLEDNDGESGEDESTRDLLDGGPGIDEVDLSHLTEVVAIDLANPDADDELRNVEDVITGPAADTIKGTRKPNTIHGSGRDVIYGRGGDDRLETDAGGRLLGGNGDDALDVVTRDESVRTRVNCGRGNDDEVRSWPTDRLSFNCERAWAGRIYIDVERLTDYNQELLRKKGILRLDAMCAHGDQARGCSGRIDMLRENGDLASRGFYEVHEDWARVEFKLKRGDRKRLRDGHTFTFSGRQDDSYGFRMRLEL